LTIRKIDAARVLSRRFAYPGKHPPRGDGSVEASTEDLADFFSGD
jgi:hypothetical protein